MLSTVCKIVAGLRAAEATTAAVSARGFLTSRPATVVEKGPHQTDSQEGVKKPFVEEGQLASKRAIRDSYEDILKEKSGTAEDVTVKDKAQSTLGSMMANPRDVEAEYAQKGRDSVRPFGGREGEGDDDETADAVFDPKRSDKGYDEAAKQSMPADRLSSKQPK